LVYYKINFAYIGDKKIKYYRNIAIEYEKLPWVFLGSKIYRIEKKKLFYILFKLETLLEFMDFNCSESSFRLTKWLRKEILLEEETLDVLKSKDFSYKFVRKIQKIDSKFFKVK